MSAEPWRKLKPWPDTPPDELCSCAPPRVWKLMWALGPNPIHCVCCNLEIRPEELEIPAGLFQAIAHWAWIWGSFEKLWFDSGPYEQWAEAELADLKSPINREALEVVKELAEFNPCYFQVFEDTSGDEWTPVTNCRSCGARLAPYKPGKFAYNLCEGCLLLFWGE